MDARKSLGRQRPTGPGLPPPEQKFPHFCAIFEFRQDAGPRTVFEMGDIPGLARGEFCLWIANTPTNTISMWDSPPIVIRSRWQDTHYVSAFLQIQDVEARGLSRSIVFVIANQSPDLIDFIPLVEKRRFLKLSEELRIQPKTLFESELPHYLFALKKLIGECQGDDNLRSTLSELEQILQEHNIVLSPPIGEPPQIYSAESFTRIRSELRSIESLLDIQSRQREIEQFIDSLPTVPFVGNAIVALSDTSFVFGKSPSLILSLFADPSRHISFLQGSPICDCLFSLFSGRTLVIESPIPPLALNFAQRLSALSPTPSPFTIGGSILIVENADSIPNDDSVSILRLESKTFIGPSCPQDSFVNREFRFREDETEIQRIVAGSQNAKRMFGRLCAKLAEISRRIQPTREDVMRALLRVGFSRSDEPICTNWMGLVDIELGTKAGSVAIGA
jgi:hypothetical protein